MTRDLDPERESALRRRLASFGDAIAVPPADDGSGDALSDATVATDLALVRQDPRGPDRRGRPVVLAAAAATVMVAAAAGALTLTRGDDDTEATSATTATTSAAGVGTCEPRVAEDGVIASGPTEGGSGWAVRVSGAPPHVATNVIVDGASAGGTMNDELSRAPLVNNGTFSLNAGISEQGGIVYGEVPRETAIVEVTTDEGTPLTACPVTVPTDELIAWFGLSLPPGVHPTGARALDPTDQVLASGEINWDRAPGIPGEGPGSVGTYMTADPALVDLPLGGTEMELPPPVERTEILSGTAGDIPWTLRAALDGDGVEAELESARATFGYRVGPTPLTERATWQLQEVGDELVLWGLLPSDATTVTIALDDGTSSELATVAAKDDGSARAFAGTLPPGAVPMAIEARRDDGSVALRATDVGENVATLAGDMESAALPAEPPA